MLKENLDSSWWYFCGFHKFELNVKKVFFYLDDSTSDTEKVEMFHKKKKSGM